jgi:hypothetical protein
MLPLPANAGNLNIARDDGAEQVRLHKGIFFRHLTSPWKAPPRKNFIFNLSTSVHFSFLPNSRR